MTKDFERLWKDVTSAEDEVAAIRALAEILAEKDGRAFVSRLERKYTDFCIDVLDRGIATQDLKTTERRAFFVTLRRLAGSNGRLPDSMMISEKIEIEDKIVAKGGFADVKIGRCAGSFVAVKTLRAAETDDLQELKKLFCKEVVLWSTLSHPHVLKLKGVYGDMESRTFTTVSEWMVHGNIMGFIKKNHVNRLELLHGAAHGLEYLHDAGLAHGDLMGANILVSNDEPPRACLADFGFTTMIMDPSQSCSVQREGGTITFMSPELLLPSVFGAKNAVPTPESDIYAFSLVIFQVLTGEIPFRGVRTTELGFSLVRGLRPEKPANAPAIGFSDSLWTFVQRCWDGDRHSRPGVAEVVTHLAEAAANWRGLMPPCGETENIACVSEESISRSMRHSSIFARPPSVVLESSDDLQTTRQSGGLGSPPTALAEPPREDPREIIATLPVEPHRESRGAMGRQPQEPPNDLRESRHVAQTFQPPPKVPPSPKRNPFQRFKPREFFGRPRRNIDSPPGIVYQTNHPGQLLGVTKDVSEDSDDLDLPLPTPSIYNMDSGSSLSVQTLGDSIEISAVLTPDGIDWDEFVPSPDPPPLKLAEINAEFQDHQEFIDKLDMMLDHTTCDKERRKLLNILCKACSRQRMLPKSMHIAGSLAGELVEAKRGGHATIFRARHNNCQVAVKTIRVTSSDFDECHSEFCREAVVWRHLRHPNILPLLGVDLEPHRLSMISEWMDQGNINEYVKEQEGVNRLQLLFDVATGLEYMHSLDMVHGDLKGANILINQSHRACLADFGLSTIASVEHNTGANASSISVASKASLMSFVGGGTFRWTSPELLHPGEFGATDDRPTKRSDCYALGMVVYEVLSGNPPFWNIKNSGRVIRAIIEGYRPKKPDGAESLGFTNELWKTIQRCWLADANARPDVRTILSHLNHATWSWERRWAV